MTRDPVMQERYRADGLRHNRIGAPLVRPSGARCCSAGPERSRPRSCLDAHRRTDPVVITAASREGLIAWVPADKTFLLYPKMLHEPFNETSCSGLRRPYRWLRPESARKTRPENAIERGAGGPPQSWVSAISMALRRPLALFKVSSYLCRERCRNRRRRPEYRPSRPESPGSQGDAGSMLP